MKVGQPFDYSTIYLGGQAASLFVSYGSGVD